MLLQAPIVPVGLSPTCARHVYEDFINDDLLIIDHGSCDVGLESTIIRVYDDHIVLLRPGAVSARLLTEISGLVVLSPASERIIAPGMMKSHYAPRAKIRLNIGVPDEGEALLGFGSGDPIIRDRAACFLNLSEDGNLV